ncbi:MAG: hypothetical protein ACI8XM_002338 [Haloarculaceae archaeon]
MTDRPRAVHVHVHLAMTGTFPLRVADLLFTDDALVVPEYEYLTPLLGIARGKASEVGRRARERYREEGLAGLVDSAERTHEIPYAHVECVRIYDDSGLGRPKIAVDVPDGPPYAYRIHAPVDVDELSSALQSLGTRRNFRVETSSALGFRPTSSLRRFLADR